MKINQIVKDNYLTLTVISTVLAGVWQILVLANIGAPYIRFFSSTQLLADSFAFLFLFFWLAISYALLRSNFPISYDNNGGKSYTAKENKINILRLIYGALGMGFIIYTMYKVNQGTSFLTYIVIIFCFVFLIMASLQYFSYEENKVYKHIVNLIILGLFVFTLINFNSIFNNFSNLENVENVCKNDECKVRYFNDKYIFIEYVREGNTSIKVLPFEELFEFNEKT